MKKKLLITAALICVIALLGVGTFAYFQSQKNLTNYFAVAGVSDIYDDDATVNANQLFSIRLDESVYQAAGRTEEGNVYKDILPGDLLAKDPTVTNTGKYDAWVRVKLAVSDAAAWQAACQKHGITDLTTIFGGFDSTAWTRYDAPAVANDTITYVFYLNAELAPEAQAVLFETFTVPGAFDSDDLSSLATFNIEITAEAIQVRNTADNAVEAFQKWEP